MAELTSEQIGVAERPDITSGPAPGDALKGRSLLFCIPAYGRPHIQHNGAVMASVIRLMRLGVDVNVRYLAECALLVRARNDLLAHFMASHYDYALFVDNDIVFEPDAPERLMLHDVPFVAAVAKSRGNSLFCLRNFDWKSKEFDYSIYNFDTMAGLIRCEAVGFAFTMLRRDGVGAMERAYPNMKVQPHSDHVPEDVRKHLYGFFMQIHTPDGILEGEDYSYCLRWNAIGGEVLVDPTIELTHFREEVLGGRLIDEVQIQTPEQADAA
jgi:glycosyltransferase involved in cell wall biosynthesis